VYSNYPAHKIKDLRKRALLTQLDVKSLIGLSPESMRRIENGISRPRKRTLDKLLTLFSTRISRLESMERIFDKNVQPTRNESPGPVRTNGVVKRDGPKWGDYQTKSPLRDARGGIQDYPAKSLERERQEWKTERLQSYERGEQR
jgi:transcriptional regulator with XRE-family HTH domain